MEIINWNMVKHPLNWVILFLMVFVPLTLAHVLLGKPNEDEGGN